jgi:glycosyltransferase involved in cell wall biosynthesis
MSPKITVVTVVYNDYMNIARTLESVIKQTYENIEYVVIDGNSKDGTKEIIDTYKDSLSFYLSEPDNGIYDAMNKAIDIATGEWIIFINSGDLLSSNNTLSQMAKESFDAEIVYGCHINPDNNRVIHPRPLDQFWLGMPFNHQSTLTKTYLYKQKKFDLNYKISAVYDFYYYFFLKKRTFKYIDRTIAIYDMNGISAYSFRWLNDYWKINLKYAPKSIIKVSFRLIYIFLSRIKSNIKRRLRSTNPKYL